MKAVFYAPIALLAASLAAYATAEPLYFSDPSTGVTSNAPPPAFPVEGPADTELQGRRHFVPVAPSSIDTSRIADPLLETDVVATNCEEIELMGERPTPSYKSMLGLIGKRIEID